jgi:3-methyladenine DNA glycosylase AlkD
MATGEISQRLRKLGSRQQAAVSQRYFKTGPGEYGEGDIFVGVRVPVLRKLVKDYADLPLDEIKTLLRSPIHEERLLALFLMVHQAARGNDLVKKAVYKLYLDNTRFVNNWDLVDLSAQHIVGAYLADKNRSVLYDLAESDILWERRIAIMSTFHFIKNHDFADTVKIAVMLLRDHHDLIHKAVGWMLREIGKRDLKAEEAFLQVHYQKMPRTMLRYAIEKFPEPKRQRYLKGRI